MDELPATGAAATTALCSSAMPANDRASAATSSNDFIANDFAQSTKTAVRHLEKRRTSTCRFADRIASISIEHYRKLVLRKQQEQQQQDVGSGPQQQPTCLATIVAFDHGICRENVARENTKYSHDSFDDDNNKKLHVIALGVGTKFLQRNVLDEEELGGLVYNVLDDTHTNHDHASSDREIDMNADSDAQRGVAHDSAAGDETNQRQMRTCCSSIPLKYGGRVRDCHAEVLARRAFRRFISLEILRDLREEQQQQQIDIKRHQDGIGGGDDGTNDANAKKQGEVSDATTGAQHVDDNPPVRILERIEETKNSHAGNTMDDGVDEEQKHTTHHPYCCYYRLRPNITLHFYCSSAPCGNAVLKKFATMKKERFINGLSQDEWPTERHEYMPGHSIPLGQFALLLKKDTYCKPSNNYNDQMRDNGTRSGPCAKDNHGSEAGSKRQPPSLKKARPTRQSAASSRKLGKKQAKWPMYNSEGWCPPGTVPAWTTTGSNIHTCSDKLCRWNCLGMQGSLIMSLLEGPLYMSTLTVGRKLTSVTCRRAVCCRIGKDETCVTKNPCTNVDDQSTKISPRGNIESSSSSSDIHNEGSVVDTVTQEQEQQQKQSASIFKYPFRLNHPSILGTSVYMDEHGFIEMHCSDATTTEVSVEDVGKTGAPAPALFTQGQDVRFHSSSSYAWWPGGELKGMAECINGSTGYLTSHDKDCDEGRQSLISTNALISLFLQIKALLEDYTPDKRADRSNNDCPSSKTNATVPTSLSQLRRFKFEHSEAYEDVKRQLFTSHPVLREWRRRSHNR